MKRLNPLKTRRLPFGVTQQRGMLQHRSYCDLAARVLEGRTDRLRHLKVRLARAQSELRHGDKFVVHGMAPAPPQLTVAFLEAPEIDIETRAARRSGEVDWDHGILPPRRRLPQQRRVSPEGLAPCIEDDDNADGRLNRLLALETDALYSSESDGSDSELVVEDGVDELSGDESEHGVELGDDEAAAVAPAELRPGFVMQNLPHNYDLDFLMMAFPAFKLTPDWHFVRTSNDGTPPQRIGRIRCIDGVSLKTTCLLPGHGTRESPFGDCKCHLQVYGNFMQCQAAIVKWFIDGTAQTKERHKESSIATYRAFRDQFARLR